MTAEHRGWGKGFPVNRSRDMTPVDAGGVRVSVHKTIAPLVRYLLEETTRRGYRLRRGECWGYANRAVAGTSVPSNHSWGLAVDLNAPSNPLTHDGRLVTDMPPWLPALWKAWGFSWGGDYRGDRKDAMHYEFLGTPGDARGFLAKLELLEKQPAQVVSPPVSVTTGEAEGMRLVTNFVNIPALDGDGRGWFDLPAEWEEVASVTGHGSSPPDDGYWPPVTVNAQPRAGKTRVTIYGVPNQRAGFWWKQLQA